MLMQGHGGTHGGAAYLTGPELLCLLRVGGAERHGKAPGGSGTCVLQQQIITGLQSAGHQSYDYSVRLRTVVSPANVS